MTNKIDKKAFKQNFLKLRSKRRQLKRQLKANKLKQKHLKQLENNKTVKYGRLFRLCYIIGSLLFNYFFLFCSFAIVTILFKTNFYMPYLLTLFVGILIVDLALWYVRKCIKNTANYSTSFGTKLVTVNKIMRPELSTEFIINEIFFTISFLSVFLFALPLTWFALIQFVQIGLLIITPVQIMLTLYAANIKVYQIKDSSQYALLVKNNFTNNTTSEQSVNNQVDEDTIQVTPLLPQNDKNKFNLIK